MLCWPKRQFHNDHMDEIEKLLVELDPKNPESQKQITQLYQLLDEACDAHKITVNEWRVLLNRVEVLRAEISMKHGITK